MGEQTSNNALESVLESRVLQQKMQIQHTHCHFPSLCQRQLALLVDLGTFSLNYINTLEPLSMYIPGNHANRLAFQNKMKYLSPGWYKLRALVLSGRSHQAQVKLLGPRAGGTSEVAQPL